MTSDRNVMEQFSSFLVALKRMYDQQGQMGKILLPVFLMGSCCLCSVLVDLASRRDPANRVPSPVVFPSLGAVATPTALFNFGTVTYAPFPTFPTSSPFPTLTSLPTETPTVTQIAPTATGTATALPTLTNLPTITDSPVPTGGSVQIIAVNKAMEYVDLQNLSPIPVDLTGWKLVSETGSQTCRLRGMLEPNEVLRVWAGKGSSGFSCKFSFNVWNDNQSDPAVLYNAQGQEVSRFP